MVRQLGRGLINAQPQADAGQLDEGEIVGGELVVASGDAATLLDLVEEPLDQIAVPVEVRTEADRVLAIAFRRDVCPRALLAGECPNPVRVISSICQQHGSWLQSGQEHRTEPIVMRLTGREAELHRQTIGVHDGVNLAGKSASRTAHMLFSVARDAGPVLVHAHDRRIDHLHRRIMSGLGLSASFDAGRGCPYQCSFCTIINVQGRKSRFRSADDVETLVRLNWAQGIHKFFITDDNFARNKEWEAIFDRLIELREKNGIPLGLMIQVDTLCHKIANFVEKAKRAGVTRVFIGLENINPDNLTAAKKHQNKITEYRKMLLAWKAQGIITLAGYILGFPSDTPETIRRDIAIIQKELPLDVIEFFCLTPLPGSEDHQVLWKKGVAMDPDLNAYDVEHVCTAHPKMSKQEWEDIYREAWSLYYTPKHMKTLLRRAVATGVPMGSLVKVLVTFATTVRLENVHPLQSGILRVKRPSERRPCLPRENPWIFWSRSAWEILSKHAIFAGAIVRLLLTAIAISHAPAARRYMDQALTPVGDDETLDLFTKTAGGDAAVAHIRKVAGIIGTGQAA